MAVRQHFSSFGRMVRNLVAGSVALMATGGASLGDTAITVGRTNVGNIAHLPIYVAMETGLFKQEGLDARFVSLTERALVTAGLGGNVNFIPLPGAGAQAALKGAAVRFVVGQSLFSPSVLVASREIGSAAQLRNRSLGFGQRGQASYHDGENVLGDKFNLYPDEDYQAIAIPSERDRLAALENGEIQAGLFSPIFAAKAEARGFRRLIKTGVFLPRLQGTIWTNARFLKLNPDVVYRFTRAIAKATDVIHTDGKTTIAVIRKNLGLFEKVKTKALWHTVKDNYSADIPVPLLKNLFTNRHQRIDQKGLWPRGKPIPNAEYFVARGLLTRTLNQMVHAMETMNISTGIR